MSAEADCRLWVEQDEGPYHLADQAFRADLVDDRVGVPLRLVVTLRSEDGGPMAGATVDVWHCDALGRYSGFGPAGPTDSGERFLRGRQVTDRDGRCEFRTIYPGWYGGRTVHIHVIAELEGCRVTSQLFFPDSINDEVLSRSPYAERPGRDTTNTTDEIFAHQGQDTVVGLTQEGDGYEAAICLQVGSVSQTPEGGGGGRASAP